MGLKWSVAMLVRRKNKRRVYWALLYIYLFSFFISKLTLLYSLLLFVTFTLLLKFVRIYRAPEVAWMLFPLDFIVGLVFVFFFFFVGNMPSGSIAEKDFQGARLFMKLRLFWRRKIGKIVWAGIARSEESKDKNGYDRAGNVRRLNIYAFERWKSLAIFHAKSFSTEFFFLRFFTGLLDRFIDCRSIIK